MAQSLGSAFRSFWHTMTSYDRHSSHDSPFRTGRHVPLNSHGGLTSVTTASESRADGSSPWNDDVMSDGVGNGGMDISYGGAAASPGFTTGPPGPAGGPRPYSPGLRSRHAQRSNRPNNPSGGSAVGQDAFEMQSPTGEIPMQSFQDGLPPPPSVVSTWAKIDRWADENYPELYDQLCEGCTANDINELEHQLDCTLPQDVRESLQVHDGQECGGIPTGIIFGAMLLDCEEIIKELIQWRRVNQEYLLEAAAAGPTAGPLPSPSFPSKALGGSGAVGGSSSGSSSSSQPSSAKASPSTSTTSTTLAPPTPNNPMWRQDLLAKQDSVPPGAVQRAYAHPAWIPLVRDWGGNNLAIDLAPGPRGHWGQVILFGRDYDTKYVVARSWAAFLAIVAADLSSGRWFVDEDTQELKLREFKKTRVEPAYFDILRWRMDQKYGRNKRRSQMGGNRSGTASPTGTASPYVSSPIAENAPDGIRGRTMQRLNGASSPLASPIRPGYSKSSPLAKVTEEAGPMPLSPVPNGGGLNLKKEGNAAAIDKEKQSLLGSMDTPRPSGEENTRDSIAPGAGKKASAASASEEAEAGEVSATNTAPDSGEERGTNSAATAANSSIKIERKPTTPQARMSVKQPMVLEQAMKTIEI